MPSGIANSYTTTPRINSILPSFLHNYKNCNNNEEFITDPLPFDYGDIAELEGKDILNIANSVMNDDSFRMMRRLPDPKPIKELIYGHNHPMSSNLYQGNVHPNPNSTIHHHLHPSAGNSTTSSNTTTTTTSNLENLLDRPSHFQYPSFHHNTNTMNNNNNNNNTNNNNNNNNNSQNNSNHHQHQHQHHLVHHSNNHENSNNSVHHNLGHPNSSTHHNLGRLASSNPPSNHHNGHGLQLHSHLAYSYVNQKKDNSYQLPNFNVRQSIVSSQPQNRVQQKLSEQRQSQALIKIKTPLKQKYWRNGRRNLQCFPTCKVFGDYSFIKLENLKQHDFMWGKCRGSVEVSVSMADNVDTDNVLVMARIHSLENLPVPFDAAAMRECMSGRVVPVDIMDIMKENWIVGDRMLSFGVSNTATFEFKPKVWKYIDDVAHGKCKRRNVRYYLQVEAFVPFLNSDVRSFLCIGSGISTSFEVGSSRVLARQKRKAACTSNEESSVNHSDPPLKSIRLEP